MTSVYIGVNDAGEVTMIATIPELIPSGHSTVKGVFDDEQLGVIHVADDGSAAAAAILRTPGPIGLGWSFR